jgi:hydroxyacylglutathione hydrolase
VSGTAFATKAGFVLDAARPVCVLAATAEEARQAVEGLHSVAFFDIAGYVLGGGGDEQTQVATIDELEMLIANGAEVLDVREKDDRDTGYVPGSRNIPYRLLATCCPDLPTDRPVVTICDSGPRAAIAASILRAKGYDARPIVDGGMIDWRARGGVTVEFRRCGSAHP